MTATLNLSRARDIFDAWRSADPSSTGPAAIFLVRGDGPAAINERSAGLLQYVLGTAAPPTNVACLLTRRGGAASTTTMTTTADDGCAIAIFATAPVAVNAGTDATAGSVIAHTIRTVPATAAADEVAAFVQHLSGCGVILAIESELNLHYSSGSGPSAFAGVFIDAVRAHASTTGTALTNAQALVGTLLDQKDAAGLLATRKANVICSSLFKNFVFARLKAIADSPVKVLCTDLTDKIGEYLARPNTAPGLETMKDPDTFGAHLSPAVMNALQSSGGASSYDERVGGQAEVAAVPVHKDVVIVRYGARQMEQAAFFARTCFFESLPAAETAAAKAAFDFAVMVQNKVSEELGAAAATTPPTRTVRDVFETVRRFAAQLDATLATKLEPSFGWLAGPVMLQKRTTIAEAGTIVVKPSMTFVIRVVLQGVPVGAAATTTATTTAEGAEAAQAVAVTSFTIELADTVAATEVLASKKGRTFAEVTVPVDGEIGSALNGADKDEHERVRELKCITRSGGEKIVTTEEKRLDIQQKLWERKMEQAGDYAGPVTSDPADELVTVGRLSSGTLAGFSSQRAAIPQSVVPGGENFGSLYVHMPSQTAWLPLSETAMTPFHVATINRVEVKPDGVQGFFTCRVTFASTQESNVAFKNHRNNVFVKDAVFRAPTSRVFDKFNDDVMSAKEAVKEADKKRKQEKGALSATNVGISGATVGVLENVKIRPQPLPKYSNTGRFEARQTGFRFTLGTNAIPPIEVLYDNVAYCIVQPSSNEVYTIFHVVLRQPIQFGKIRDGVREFQVVAEVMSSSEDVKQRSRHTYEQQLAEEERERKRVADTNREFLTFAGQVRGSVSGRVFAPGQSVDFDASVGKGSVRMRGSRQGVWSISEMPFFSCPFSDVEIVMLERVVAGGKNFDIALVPKNYRAKVVQISTVPMKVLDDVKNWLCGADMIYIEIGQNLNYAKLLKQFESDPDWNPWTEEGWRTMVEDDDGEEGEGGDDSDEDDSSWSGSSEAEDDSDDDSSLEDDDGTDASSSAVSDDDAESSGGDWSDEEDDEDDFSSVSSAPRKKKAAPPPRR